MATNENPPNSAQARGLRQWLGFKNRYDFWLWSFFGGILALFCVVRTPYLHFPTYARGTAYGELYWMRQQPYKFAILFHLWTILPAAVMCITQFVPRIRSKSMLMHRIFGYIVIGLVFLSIFGAIVITPHTFGGDGATQTAVYTLAAMTDTALFLAWWNVRRLQIDQHRKWMIRAMVWMSQIITLRIIFVLGLRVIQATGVGRDTLWTCDEALFVVQNETELHAEFPQCGTLGPSTRIGVPMRLDSPLHVNSAFRGLFAPSIWLAMALHVAAVEIYLAATPAESARLRLVSYHKQRAAGMLYPGSAGITSDRWGLEDAKPWVPPGKSKDA